MTRPKTSKNPFCITAILLALLLGVPGCVHDDLDSPVPGDQKDLVSIDISIPGFDTPLTRSIEGDKGEAAVKTIDILVFDKSTPAKLTEHVKVPDIANQGAAGSDYKVELNVKLKNDADARTVAVIANASDQVDDAITAAPIGSEKDDVMDALTFATQKANDSYKWDVSAANYTPIPMYGEAAVSNGIKAGTSISGLKLTRMLARIDVENKVSGDTFKLDTIYLVNYNTTGYIAPAWDSDGVIIPDNDPACPYSNNKNPMIPDPSGKQPGNYVASAKYKYTQGADSPGPLLAGEIYTYEANMATGTGSEDAANAACLIVKGVYEGEEYYYRIDFTAKSEDTPVDVKTIKYMPLYRNYKYVVTITAAEGIGYKTFAQALNSTTVLSNLKTSLLVVDLSGINDIVFNGQYFMGSENKGIDVLWGISRSVKQGVSTNYTGDWSARIVNPDNSKWLTFAGGQTAASGTDLNASGLDLELARLDSAPAGGKYEIGKIALSAGRLRDTLIVRRVPIANMFARSNVVAQGSGNSKILTFAVTEGDNESIPAYSQGVFFKWGSLVALSPAGNPYDPSAHVVYNPTSQNPTGWGNLMVGWDKVPYAHDNFSFNEPVNIDDDADEFKNYNNGKGFDAANGVGDICRYISSSENGKWVEGKWRMPTYAEIQMLYDETKQHEIGIGEFKNLTDALIPTDAKQMNGFYNPASGWWFGANVTGSTPSAANMQTPPDGTVFLPTAGLRYPNGNGSVVHVGPYGYYWTSTPYSNVTVNYPFLDNGGMTYYDADRSYAFPIRCIRDY